MRSRTRARARYGSPSTFARRRSKGSLRAVDRDAGPGGRRRGARGVLEVLACGRPVLGAHPTAMATRRTGDRAAGQPSRGAPSTSGARIALPDVATGPESRARRRHGNLGLHVRPGAGGPGGLPALRVPRSPVRDLDRRAGPIRLGSLRELPGQVGWRGSVRGRCSRRYGLQTAGLELTTVTSTGFITGLYVVFTPLLALAAFRARAGPRLGRGRARRGRAPAPERGPWRVVAGTCSSSGTPSRSRSRSSRWSGSHRATTLGR